MTACTQIQASEVFETEASIAEVSNLVEQWQRESEELSCLPANKRAESEVPPNGVE